MKSNKSAWDSIENSALKGAKNNKSSKSDLNLGKHTIKILAGILIYFASVGVGLNIYWLFSWLF